MKYLWNQIQAHPAAQFVWQLGGPSEETSPTPQTEATNTSSEQQDEWVREVVEETQKNLDELDEEARAEIQKEVVKVVDETRDDLSELNEAMKENFKVKYDKNLTISSHALFNTEISC